MLEYMNEPVVRLEVGDERNLFELLDRDDSAPNFIHVRHSENAKPEHNLTQISRHSLPARHLLVELTRRGFYTYMSGGHETRLVRERRIPQLWEPLKSGQFSKSSEGVIYSLAKPSVEAGKCKLLVFLCPMHENIYTSSLYRYFPQNFKTIQKFIAPETAILRIADLGGVVGNFYGNTLVHPDNIDRIQTLVGKIMLQLDIVPSDVVLYGGSKGGTGALLHGLVGGYKVVAVDPVLGDRHYEERFRDSHFTRETIFPLSKDELFDRLVSEYRGKYGWDSPGQRKVVVYSSRSPQALTIQKLLFDQLEGGIAGFDVDHPSIQDHPDVGPNSLPITTTIINSLLYGLEPPVGFRQIV